jgi:hypothetical protein
MVVENDMRMSVSPEAFVRIAATLACERTTEKPGNGITLIQGADAATVKDMQGK